MARSTVDAGDEVLIGFREMSREEAQQAARRWHSTSTETLLAGGDEHGYDVHPVAQMMQPPHWDEGEGGYVLRSPHTASRFFEDGTAAHDIEGDPLAFEWEDAPAEVQEAYADTFPLVFFQRVHVAGIEALDFWKTGRKEAERYLEGAGA